MDNTGQPILPFWRRFLPFLCWSGELRDPSTLRADMVAGITVALVLIPQSMAYAQLAGLPPYFGLYAAFLPPLVAALFGSSRQLATGPVAVVSLLTAAALEPWATAGSESYVAYAILLALLVGVFQITLGLLRLGVLVNFLSHPVVLGFTNAAAIIIATSQLDKILGVSVAKAEQHYQTVWNTLLAGLDAFNWPTLAMAVLAFAIILGLRQFAPRLPGVLLAVVATTVLSWLMDYAASGGAVVGDIPRGLPSFQAPQLDWAIILDLLVSAVTIALIGFMEAIAIAKSMATSTRQRLDANQELVGQGMGNLLGSLFQSYAVAGSFSRSAVNLEAGAVTGFSSVVTSLVVVAALLWLTPLIYHLPQATLAAVIMVAVVGLVRIAPFRHVWRAHRQDGAVAAITFVLTLILAPHLDEGIIIGVGLSLGLYLYRTMQPRVAVLSRHTDGVLRDANIYNLEHCQNIAVIRFDGSLYFANTGYFEDKVLEKMAAYPELKFVIVVAEGINEIDSSGEEMLLDLEQRLREAGIELLFSHMKRQSLETLQRSGFMGRLGEGHFFPHTGQALQYAWKQLEPGHEQNCPLRMSARNE